jgi:hypothetical protein
MKRYPKHVLLILILIVIVAIFIPILFYPIRENFTWSDESTRNFLKIQKTINPKKIFDTETIQKYQASQEEVNYFNKHGYWKWSPKTKQLYMEALQKNPYIRTYSPSELKYVMSIYNEAAILKILSYQSEEGQFLLNGVMIPPKTQPLPDGFGDFAYNSGEFSHSTTDDIIKCNMDTYDLERTTNTKQYGLYGQQLKETTQVDYNHLENMIPGFSFVNEPCNPCHNIDATSNYPCPFKLQTKDSPSPRPSQIMGLTK